MTPPTSARQKRTPQPDPAANGTEPAPVAAEPTPAENEPTALDVLNILVQYAYEYRGNHADHVRIDQAVQFLTRQLTPPSGP